MSNFIPFLFFKKKNKTVKEERSMWKIVEHPHNKNRLLKFILVNSLKVKLRLYRTIQQEIRTNKLLLKKRKYLSFVLVPINVQKISNKSNETVYYIEMEKMDGDLTQLKGNIDWTSIILQITVGLIHLNRIGIKHGDLAPRNILFKKIKKDYKFTLHYKKKKYTIPVNGIEIKIADFGLANYSRFSKVKDISIQSNLAYLSSTLMFNRDFRIKTKKKFNFPKDLKKKITGVNKISKSRKSTYDFLKGKIKLGHILKELL